MSPNWDAVYVVQKALEKALEFIDSNKGDVTDKDIAEAITWVDLRDEWEVWIGGSD